MRLETPTLVVLVLLALGSWARSANAQPATPRPGPSLLGRGAPAVTHRPGPFSLEVGVGAAGVDGVDPSHFALTIAPRFTLYRRGWARLDLSLPLLWIPGTRAPSRSLVCFGSFEGGETCSHLTPLSGNVFDLRFGVDDLEVGPTIVLAPSLEWTFPTECCLRPSLFVGVGVLHQRGRATLAPTPLDLEELGAIGEGLRLTPEDTISPLVTLGAALERPLSRRLALRLEARVITTFYERTLVVGARDRELAELDGETLTSALLSFGLRWNPAPRLLRP